MAQRLHIFQSKTPESHTSFLKEGFCNHTSPVTAKPLFESSRLLPAFLCWKMRFQGQLLAAQVWTWGPSPLSLHPRAPSNPCLNGIISGFHKDEETESSNV